MLNWENKGVKMIDGEFLNNFQFTDDSHILMQGKPQSHESWQNRLKMNIAKTNVTIIDST